jgi:predicted lysophospholipase L1 biosynthesis ABC-type transport system permease subunit
MEIVAVVSDAKYQRMDEPPRSIAYLARAQIAGMPSDANLFAEVRAARPDAALAESVRRAVRSLDARVPLRIETVSDRIRQSLVRERLMALLAATLGLAALILACAALYGLLAYAVSRQSYEIGLRLALGAQRRSILWRVLGECLMLALLGTTMGLCASLVLGRYVQTTLLYQITPADSIAMGAAALIMIAVASLAGAIPARRAARVDPAVALRVD